MPLWVLVMGTAVEVPGKRATELTHESRVGLADCEQTGEGVQTEKLNLTI